MTSSEESFRQHRATGSFAVTMVPPQPAYDTVDEVALGRMTINKVWSGDLDGTSVVEMLTAMTAVKGSAGYVAIERVTGALKDESGAVRRGTFVLQHSCSMSGGAQQMTISIVPDSGTGELRGVSGTLRIDIVEGKHSYTLDWNQ